MKINLVLIFAALVYLGSARGDVTGVALSSNIGENISTSLGTTLQITFTTSNGAPSFFLNSLKLVTGGFTDEAKFSLVSYADAGTNITSTYVDGPIGFSTFDFVGAGFNTTLAASTQYTLYVSNLSTGYSTGNTSTLISGIAPLNFTGSQTSDSRSADTFFRFELLATAVPEPATMILTGAALAAGAVGAYCKRRRKVKTEVAG
ncbi:MAG: PEP-CTERM sorting domain-containing protein [Gemmataceae bacterium]